MHKDFKQQFTSFCDENLIKTERMFATERQNHFSALKEHFSSICDEIVKLQNDSILSAISHIEYTMLYSNFINRKYVVEIWVYREEHYNDTNQRMVGEYDISPLFIYFDELWESLIALRRRYVNKVSANDINACMLQALPSFYSYMVSAVRHAVKNCTYEKPFTDIAKNDVFSLSVGEYMANIETVYNLNEDKNTFLITMQTSKDEDFEGLESSLKDCSDLDFSDSSFSEAQLSYAQFGNSILNDVPFDNATLIGADFYRAKMERCNLNYSIIYEANFSGAQLKEASFQYAGGHSGSINSESWQQVGYLPVNFQNADLTNANFHGAFLKGADFRGATIENTNFTEAVLDGAIFSTKDLPLSPEQLATVKIEEGS